MGCELTDHDGNSGTPDQATCTGYELIASLTFDENGDGQVTATGDPTYWDSNKGWLPLGAYTGHFKGNGNTIDLLTIGRTGTNDVGLFSSIGSSSRIETVGITNATVTGSIYTGILAGTNSGSVVASYTTGAVSGTTRVGGIIGYQGLNNASIHSSYSTASVSGTQHVGGVLGQKFGSMTNSYATGLISRLSGGASEIGGLIGFSSQGTTTASYYDSSSSGCVTGGGSGCTGSPGGGVAKTARELQTVTGYTTGSIYADWNVNLDGVTGNDDPWDFGNNMQYPMLKYAGMSTDPQGGQAMGIPDNWNAPVAGERLGVCLTADDFPNRGIVSGQTYKEAWVWESSTNGVAWSTITGAGDGNNPPTYEYTPSATDVGNFIRAKVKMTDGAFATTRALGGRVVASSGATAGAEVPFRYGHEAPRVGSKIVTTDPVPAGAVDSRFGWQRCPNNTAPHSDCEHISHIWWVEYTPTADDVGNYLRMYVYYETADGAWTRHETPFTTGVVAR